MLLSIQMGFRFVRAAVACAILERTSGLDLSSETTAPRYLKLVTVPKVYWQAVTWQDGAPRVCIRCDDLYIMRGWFLKVQVWFKLILFV